VGYQAVGQPEREVPVFAAGRVLVAGACLDLELPQIRRVRIVNGKWSSCERQTCRE
jgi:hypothetical protein